MEPKGIKEILELITGLKELALGVKAVTKDGKLSFSDLTIIKDLFAKQKVLLDAFDGLKLLPSEVGDLDMNEVALTITALIDAAKEVSEA